MAATPETPASAPVVPSDSEGGEGAAAGRPPAGLAAVAGVVAAAVALGVSELAGALVPGGSSLVTGVGEAFIDVVPPPLKDWAISLFGTSDKVALLVSMGIVAAIAGAFLGVIARPRRLVGDAGLVAFGVFGAAATLTNPQFSLIPILAVGVLAAVTGALALRGLLRSLEPSASAVRPVRRPDDPPEVDRRRFLTFAVGGALGAGAAGLVGQRFGGESAVAASRAEITLPESGQPLPAVPSAAQLDVQGISPLVTPNADLYRIDTALSIPQIDVATWQMEVRGLVDRPFTLTYDELLSSSELVEVDATLCCVSNEVGGDLIGNARWLGVPLASLLERARLQDGADQIVGTAVDGFDAGFPTRIAMEQEGAIVAIGMNGEPLPARHGFPARLVVPGLYGYVSATKWLAAIELAPWSYDTYWVPRGWAKEGPVKTQSRIDVPDASAQVEAGTVAVAGVAWAQTRGIERVEVQVDDGDWAEARLADALDVDTWRQWVYEWDAEPGSHTLRVRATDGDGETQTSEEAPPAPDGAAGWHTIDVEVA